MAGSASIHSVRARSEAEMPVLMPSLASTVTVKAVYMASSFSSEVYHQRQLQSVEHAALHSQADVTAGVLSDEFHIRRRHLNRVLLYELKAVFTRSMRPPALHARTTAEGSCMKC